MPPTRMREVLKMSYQSLAELLKEHTDEEVFRAAMHWLSIQYQARWRQEYKQEHGHYPTMSESSEHNRNSRYYIPSKKISAPACAECHELCKRNEHKEWVCVNPKCFSYGS